MNRGVHVEMDSGWGWGWGGGLAGVDIYRLFKVKHVCVQTLLTKEKDCSPPFLLPL